MNELFFEILNPIKQSTGLDIDLYSLEGVLLFSTKYKLSDLQSSFKAVKKDDFIDGIKIDTKNNITQFIIVTRSDCFFGTISGANEVSRNYAVMVSRLIETALNNNKTALSLKSRIGLLLSGELSKQQADSTKAEFNKEKGEFYLVSAIVTKASMKDDLVPFLETMAERNDFVISTDSKTVVFIKKRGGDDEYSSASDFAYILHENISTELRIDFKLCAGGMVKTSDDLVTCYKHSLLAYELGILFDPKTTVYSYKEYLMVKMLSEISSESLQNCYNTLAEDEVRAVLNDSELMLTADAFMNNSLNISETSRSLYIHRNTLIYRLDKIESLSGLNIRHFNDALTFRLLTIISKLLKA